MTQEVRIFKVKSFSVPNLTYTVRQLPTGEWKCGCLNFTMNEGKRRKNGQSTNCDHIRKVRHLKMRHHGRNKK